MTLDLATLDYGEDRPGRPLVVLHGLFGSARNWATLARRFAEDRPVICADLRNHGASPWAEAMDYPTLAADLAALIDRRGLDRPAVLGHSMGGKAAMRLALDRPDAVERLVVLDIAPVPYGDRHSAYVEAMRAVPVDRLSRRTEADAYLAEAVPEAPLRAFLLQNLVSSDGALAWRINLAAIAAAMADLVAWPDPPAGRTFDGPTLVLRGGASDYVGEAGEAAIARLFPAATVETIPGAGHWAHAEQPDAVFRKVADFLED
jgi:pimeloyl-ACP methyl ester carboxylesterase